MSIPSIVNLEGKTAVITGAGSGIGRSSALLLMEHGANVVVADKNTETLQATMDIASQRGWGTKSAQCAGDVTDETHVSDLMQNAVDTFGSLDIVFNNAGAGGVFGPIEEVLVDEWDATFAILVRSVFLGMKHAVKRMHNGGSIVNTASIASMTGGAGPMAYSAAKAAVRHMSKVAAQELGAKGIRVNSISPGLIQTPLLPEDMEFSEEALKGLGQISKKVGSPDDIAKGVLYLVSEMGQFITGSNLLIDGGIIANATTFFDYETVIAPLQSSNMTLGNTGEEPILRG